MFEASNIQFIVLLLYATVVTDDGKILCDNKFGSINILYRLETLEPNALKTNIRWTEHVKRLAISRSLQI